MSDRLATDADALARRTAAHDRFGSQDLNDWLLEILRPRQGERVLDIGCGTGRQLLPIAERLAPDGVVVGLDASLGALRIVRQAARERGLDRVGLVAARMEDLGSLFKTRRRFDLVITCFSLYYSDEPRETLVAARGLLAQQGRCFVCGPALCNNQELRALQEQLAGRHGLDTPPARGAKLLDEVGRPLCQEVFRTSAEFTFFNPLSFPSVDAVLEYWRSYYLYQPALEVELARALELHIQRHGAFVTRKAIWGCLLRP